MEEDFLVATLWVLPGELQRNVFRKGTRSVAVESDAYSILIFFDLGSSHTSASPQVLFFPVVVLV